MKYKIMAKSKTDKKYSLYCGYTKLFMKIFNINDDFSIDSYDITLAIQEGLKEELPHLKFKIKKLED